MKTNHKVQGNTIADKPNNLLDGDLNFVLQAVLQTRSQEESSVYLTIGDSGQ